MDHPVVSQAWTCQTAWRHLEVPSGGSQGVQRGACPWLLQGAHKGYRRGAYHWLLQGAHKGYRGEPITGTFRGLTRGTEGRLPLDPSEISQGEQGHLDPSEISQEEHGCLTCLLKDADWGYMGQLSSADPLGSSPKL